MQNELNLTGKQCLGGQWTSEGSAGFEAVNPASGESMAPTFLEATSAEIQFAVQLAAEAFSAYRQSPREQIALFLEAIADEILALGDALLERANAETSLGIPRLTGERGRTMAQLKMFAQVVREANHLDIRIDNAQPDRAPLPKPDIRRQKIGIGPVAVFGASNFPLAFSVAGGDTASALAAGCPVIAKAHHAHPGTCELVATAINRAVEKTCMPKGVFSLIHGGASVGSDLAGQPGLAAIAFTGSHRVGRSLMDLAAARANPIPVFAEMGSVNPVFYLSGGSEERAAEFAGGYAGSLTLGVGQFCTNPGILVGASSAEWDVLKATLHSKLAGVSPVPMLTAGIAANYIATFNQVAAELGAEIMLMPTQEGHSVTPGMLRASFDTVKNRAFQTEVFGPACLLLETTSEPELLTVAAQLEGQLTATLHAAEGSDRALAADLVSILEEKVGRIVYNAFPTGVEVCGAMQHGGPYPASSDGRFTSVGTAAIERFMRPVAYQNIPEWLQPTSVRPGNPENVRRIEV